MAIALHAAGKTQRKFVLLGTLGCRVAAVIVESHKYAFVYYALENRNDLNAELQVQNPLHPIHVLVSIRLALHHVV